MELRIQFGKYKKTKLKGINKLNIRPTLARTRSILFNTLNNLLLELEEYSFLDLFAGSGIVGLEALSIGAKEVYFVEEDYKVCKTLQTNLDSIKDLDNYKVIHRSVFNIPEGKIFDVIYIDPPYDKLEMVKGVIKRLKKRNWCNNKTILILETEKKNELNLKDLVIIKEKIISNSKLIFFTVNNL